MSETNTTADQKARTWFGPTASPPRLFVLFSYVALRGWVFFLSSVERFPDTASYETLDFLARGSARFPVVPILYLMAPSDVARTWVQWVLSILSWTLLATVVAHVVRVGWLKTPAFSLVLFVSLGDLILVWDRLLIAESVALSSIALVLGAWIAFVHQPSRSSHWRAVVAMILFAFVRETHVTLTGLTAMLLAATLVCRRNRHLRAQATAILGVASVAGFWLAGANNDRWKFNLENVLAQRFLPYPERLEELQLAGMPVTPKLLSLAGKYASSDGWAFHNAPELETFRDWRDHRLRRAYGRYLLHHPIWALGAPFQDDQFLVPRQTLGAFSTYFAGFKTTLPFHDLVFPNGRLATLCSLTLVLGVVVCVWLTDAWSPSWAVPALVVASTVPHALIAWHGDAMDVVRHGVPVVVTLRVGLILIGIFVLDALLQPQRLRTGKARAPTLRGKSS